MRTSILIAIAGAGVLAKNALAATFTNTITITIISCAATVSNCGEGPLAGPCVPSQSFPPSLPSVLSSTTSTLPAIITTSASAPEQSNVPATIVSSTLMSLSPGTISSVQTVPPESNSLAPSSINASSSPLPPAQGSSSEENTSSIKGTSSETAIPSVSKQSSSTRTSVIQMSTSAASSSHLPTQPTGNNSAGHLGFSALTMIVLALSPLILA